MAFIASACVASLASAAPHSIELTKIGSFGIGDYNPEGGVAEVVAHDPSSQQLFVVSAQSNQVMVLDVADPSTPVKVGAIDISPYRPNSVAVRDGIIAVAAENQPKTDPGRVYFFDRDLQLLADVTVGALPDMLTFSPNGRCVLVANEGEPNSYGQPDSVDPEGSVSIIDISAGAAYVTQANVRTASFSDFSKTELTSHGVRIFGPGASVAQDLEPEYIAISEDSKTAWVTLQENNAVAILDIRSGSFTGIAGLGYKDFSAPENGFDPSDRDDGIKIGTWPVRGLYQPDGIDCYQVKGESFLVVANEGDVREWKGYVESIRIKDSSYKLNPTNFPNGADLKKDAKLGRLQVSKASGDLDGDGFYEEIYAFGGRSFSIRDSQGGLVWDSGNELEQLEALLYPLNFNASHSNNTLDSRSSSKGPEPENVVIGKVFGNTYAFIGLERIGGVVTYDISDLYAPFIVDYINTRDFSFTPGKDAPADVGDLGPEGLIFIKAEDSPNGKPLLVVGNEVSGTTAIFEISKLRKK